MLMAFDTRTNFFYSNPYRGGKINKGSAATAMYVTAVG